MTPVSPHTAVRAESLLAVQTNGEGKETTAHLNLTVTMADQRQKPRTARNHFGEARALKRQRWGAGKIPFAGKDDDE